MVELAAIMAAGVGTRLGKLANGRPKGFIEIGSLPIVEESILKLLAAGITRIVIGTGFGAQYYEELEERYPEVSCFYNPDFATTGSMHTLSSLGPGLNDDFVLLESDLIYEERALRELLSLESRNLILASGMTDSSDEVFIQTDSNGNLVRMSKQLGDLERADSELVGISRLSLPTYHAMCRFASDVSATQPRLDYEAALVAISGQIKLLVHQVEDLAWAEIDDASHLERAANAVYPRIRGREAERDQAI